MGGKSSTPKSKSGGTAAGARAQVSQADLAILELKIQRDKLTQHKKKVEATMARDREIAGQLVREGKRDKALLALRRRKMHAKLIEKTDDQIFNMEHMINTVEGKQREQMVFEATRAATDALKQMQQEMSLEAVEKLMEENADAIAYQEEINRLLAQNLTPVDDAVIDEELNAMMAVMQGGEKAATPAAAAAAAAAVPELPHVPVDLPLPPRDEPSLVALQPMAVMEDDDAPMPPPAEPAPA